MARADRLAGRNKLVVRGVIAAAFVAGFSQAARAEETLRIGVLGVMSGPQAS
jgi:hypothetical protein